MEDDQKNSCHQSVCKIFGTRIRLHKQENEMGRDCPAGSCGMSGASGYTSIYLTSFVAAMDVTETAAKDLLSTKSCNVDVNGKRLRVRSREPAHMGVLTTS